MEMYLTDIESSTRTNGLNTLLILLYMYLSSRDYGKLRFPKLQHKSVRQYYMYALPDIVKNRKL